MTERVGGQPNPTYFDTQATGTAAALKGRLAELLGGNLSTEFVTPDVMQQQATQVSFSITFFAPRLSGDQLDVLRATITADLRDKISEVEKDKVELEADKKKTAMQEKRTKLEEAETKMAEAKEKQESASIWDKVKMAFQILGSLLSIVVGAVLAFTGVATAAGLVMVAAGVIGLVMTIDSIIAQETGNGMAGHLAKLAGASDDVARGFDIGFQVTLAVVGIAVGIVSLVKGDPSTLTNSFLTLMRATAVASAAIDVSSAAISIGTGVVSYQAANLSADAMDLRAGALEIDAMMQMLDDLIDMAMQQMMGASDRFNAMLDGVVETMNDRGSTLSRAKFSA